MTDRAELTRLILQVERDLLARAHVRTLLAAADAAVAGDRQDLRNLKARLARLGRLAIPAAEPGRR